MSEHTKLFERAGARYGSPDLSTEGLLLRRDRKRRNQRVAAGLVGMAVFVAAVVVVATIGSLDGTRTPVVTGGTGTGTPQPSPTKTVSTDTEPVIGDPSSVGFDGLPPEGVTPSEPLRGELVMSDGGIDPWWHVRLYADGRLIWASAPTTDPDTPSAWIVQRLTPAGVELLRSGAVELGWAANPGRFLPASAWEDPELRPYVPSKYAVCLPSPQAFDLLPAEGQDLLRGAVRVQGCLEVTIDEARALVAILSDAGVDVGEAADLGMLWFGSDTFGGDGIRIVPILPGGPFIPLAGG